MQTLHRADEGKALALSTLDACADAILAEGLASEHELNAARADLAQFIDDSQSIIGGPRIFQVWSRRWREVPLAREELAYSQDFWPGH